MQYHGSKGTRERGGTFHQNSQGEERGLIGTLPFDDNIP